MFTKDQILAEIKRTSKSNGGTPLGRQRFEQATGIMRRDWYGIHWSNWGQAVAEAGLSPNRFQAAHDESWLLKSLAALVRDLGHFPVGAELRMKKRHDQQFPDHDV